MMEWRKDKMDIVDKKKEATHLDREALMGNKTVDFPVLYEAAISNFEDIFDVPDELKARLHAKRDFGLQKYKELSFQSTFLTAMTTPSLEDLEEELVDALNYSLNIHFQNIFKPADEASCDEILADILDIYHRVHSLNLENKKKVT
jgi:hypothetical protein